MKRYVVSRIEFDSRPNVLGIEIGPDWKPEVKASHERNRQSTVESYRLQFGSAGLEHKLANVLDIGPLPMSVIAFHNRFLPQIRDSFIIGSYYPSLVGSYALAERIINQLVLSLKDFYVNSDIYIRISRSRSFNDWRLPLDALEEWGAILPDTITTLRALHKERWRAIHFDPDLDLDLRDKSLRALHQLSDVIATQFGLTDRHGRFVPMPWFIPGTKGFRAVKRSYEQDPFVKTMLLPSCHLVGPRFQMSRDDYGNFYPVDEHEYEPGELSDDAWATLANSR